MQTVILCEAYARFRGHSKRSQSASPRFRKLFQMIIDNQTTFDLFETLDKPEASWRRWVEVDTRRRMFTVCFVIEFFTALLLENEPATMRNLDYEAPTTLQVPLTACTKALWEAPDARAWDQELRTSRQMETVQTALEQGPTGEGIRTGPTIDSAAVACAWTLHIRLQQHPAASEEAEAAMTKAYVHSGNANTMLMLNHVPLKALLAVVDKTVDTEDSKAATSAGRQMSPEARAAEAVADEWCRSDEATVALWYAARALRVFTTPSRFNALPPPSWDPPGNEGPRWVSIADFWSAYVCALVCWAYAKRRGADKPPTPPPLPGGIKRMGGGDGMDDEAEQAAARRAEGLRWVETASSMVSAGKLSGWKGAGETKAVVGLVGDILSRDCGDREVAEHALLVEVVRVLGKLVRKW